MVCQVSSLFGQGRYTGDIQHEPTTLIPVPPFRISLRTPFRRFASVCGIVRELSTLADHPFSPGEKSGSGKCPREPTMSVFREPRPRRRTTSTGATAAGSPRPRARARFQHLIQSCLFSTPAGIPGIQELNIGSRSCPPARGGSSRLSQGAGTPSNPPCLRLHRSRPAQLSAHGWREASPGSSLTGSPHVQAPILKCLRTRPGER